MDRLAAAYRMVSTMTHIPFFSVVIPTHNRVDLLEQAIRSVLQQTFTDFEIIVVDDHSTDNTQIRLAEYDDPRLTYFLNDHGRGGAGARNAGIARTRGQWVAFLDDDDVWLPQKLARQHQKIVAGSDAGLIYTGYAIYDFGRRQILSKKTPEKSGWLEKELLLENVVGTFSTVVARRELLKAVGGLDQRFMSRQDLDLYLRLAQLAPVDYVGQTLVYVRKGHGGRISMNWRNKLAGHQLFKEKYGELLQADPASLHRIDSRIVIYALLAGEWGAVRALSARRLIRVAIDVRNYQWLLKEWGSSYLNRWRGQAG
jgi:glycosyltransferase involved in cell wall biosynthesis